MDSPCITAQGYRGELKKQKEKEALEALKRANDEIREGEEWANVAKSLEAIRQAKKMISTAQRKKDIVMAGQTPPQKTEFNREKSAKRAKKAVRRLLNSNPDMIYMLTFTMAINEGTAEKIMSAEDQRNRGEVIYQHKLFTRKAKRVLKKRGISPDEWRWLRILELHDSEKTSEAKRGTFHLHIASNIDGDELSASECWGFGRTDTTDFSKPLPGKEVVNPGAYMSKYIVKDALRPERKAGERVYTRSRNLDIPIKIHGREELAKAVVNHELCGEYPYKATIEGTVYSGKRLFFRVKK